MITRASSCTGKIRHRNRGCAIQALKAVNNAQLSGYHCRFCNGWHLGHSVKKIQLRFDQLLGPDPNLPAPGKAPKNTATTRP